VGGADEETFSLVGKRKGKKKDMSKVKLFEFHKNDQYTSQCPNKKKGNNDAEVSKSAKFDDFDDNFEKEFCLMTVRWKYCHLIPL